MDADDDDLLLPSLRRLPPEPARGAASTVGGPVTPAPQDKRSGPYTYVLDDGTKVTLPVKELSASSISMFINCPRQFYFRYVLGQKRPPGIAMVEGTSHHEALALNNEHYIAQKRNLPVAKVVEKFCDDFATRSKEVEDWEGEKKDVIITRGTGLLNVYMETEARVVVPVGAETEFHAKVGGVPLVGYRDLDEEDTVLDYKVCGASSSYIREGAADKSLQLSIYSAVSNKKKVGYIALVKGRNKVKRVMSSRTTKQLDGLKDEIVLIAKAISSGVFPLCSADSWSCTPRFCGYYSQCRGKYK